MTFDTGKTSHIYFRPHQTGKDTLFSRNSRHDITGQCWVQRYEVILDGVSHPIRKIHGFFHHSVWCHTLFMEMMSFFGDVSCLFRTIDHHYREMKSFLMIYGT